MPSADVDHPSGWRENDVNVFALRDCCARCDTFIFCGLYPCQQRYRVVTSACILRVTRCCVCIIVHRCICVIFLAMYMDAEPPHVVTALYVIFLVSTTFSLNCALDTSERAVVCVDDNDHTCNVCHALVLSEHRAFRECARSLLARTLWCSSLYPYLVFHTDTGGVPF